jgi:hypothetical protein
MTATVLPSRLFDDEVEYESPPGGGQGPVLVVACGAIAREVLAVIRMNEWSHVSLQCLPAKLHNTPKRIAEEVDRQLERAKAEGRFRSIFVAYGDCGTGGELDRLLEARGVGRLPGDHCYGFLAGVDDWLAMHEAEPATFYLTDFLARHFDRFVVEGLGLDRHPELLSQVFGNYRRVVYLAQTDDPSLLDRARSAAEYLSLPLEVRRTGLGDLSPSLEAFVEGAGRGG